MFFYPFYQFHASLLPFQMPMHDLNKGKQHLAMLRHSMHPFQEEQQLLQKAVPYCFLMYLLWVFFLSLSSCMQYVPLLREWENTDMNITNWMISSATYTDDSPFDAVELPVSVLGLCYT